MSAVALPTGKRLLDKGAVKYRSDNPVDRMLNNPIPKRWRVNNAGLRLSNRKDMIWPRAIATRMQLEEQRIQIATQACLKDKAGAFFAFAPASFQICLV